MKPSKYLNAFNKAVELKDSHELYGDALLVEKINEEQVKNLEGGKKIYLAEVSTHRDTLTSDKPVWVHVLEVGNGFYDPETGKDSPLTVNPGDIILVGTQSVRWFSTLELDTYEPYTIGLTRESEVQLRFKGLDGYTTYFAMINSALKQ